MFPLVGIPKAIASAKHTKGRKRHTAVDTLSLVLWVVVTAASLPEREGGKKVLTAVHHMAEAVQRLNLIWADGEYRRHPLSQVVIAQSSYKFFGELESTMVQAFFPRLVKLLMINPGQLGQ